MGRIFKQYLSGPRVYCCANCRAHAADDDDMVSKAFQGRRGRAYLFNNVVNVSLGPKEDRMLMTGLHTVADIFCTVCNTNLGWKYEMAFDEGQKYKEPMIVWMGFIDFQIEGKYILEKADILKDGQW